MAGNQEIDLSFWHGKSETEMFRAFHPEALNWTDEQVQEKLAEYAKANEERRQPLFPKTGQETQTKS